MKLMQIFVLLILGTSKFLNGLNNTKIAVFLNDILCQEHLQNIVFFSNGHHEVQTKVNDIAASVAKGIFSTTFVISEYKGNNLRNFAGTDVLAVSVLESENDQEIFKLMEFALKQFKNIKIVLLTTRNITENGLNQIFTWCFKQNLLNVILIFEEQQFSGQSFKILSYNPFPQLSIVNKTQDDINLFPNKLRDLKGFTVRTVFLEDVPRVFFDGKYNLTRVQGFNGHAFVNFLQRRNAQIENIDMGNISESEKQEKIKDITKMGIVDMTPNLGDWNLTCSGGCTYINPSQFVEWCIMMPGAEEVPTFAYVFLPFRMGVWYTILGGCFYMTFIFYIAGFLLFGKWDIGAAFLHGIQVILNASFSKKDWQLSWKSICIYGQVIPLGFILSNIYLSLLSTFLTTTVYEPEIDTLQQMIKKDARIMVSESEVDMILEKFHHNNIPEELIMPVDLNTFLHNRNTFNTSYGYTVPSDKLEFFHQSQILLPKLLLRKTSVCFGHIPFGFIMAEDYMLADDFNYFLLHLEESGLYSKWKTDSFDEALKAGLAQKLPYEALTRIKTINLGHLGLVLYILLIGWSCSLLCFIGEVLRYYVNRKK